MKHTNRKTVVLTFVVVAIITAIMFLDESPELKKFDQGIGTNIGDVAPNFILTSTTGEEISLFDFRGTTVIVNFFASWCPPCRTEMPALSAIHSEHDDVIVIGVNLQEDTKVVQAFAEEIAILFPLLLDPDSQVKDMYEVRTQPVTFFIDARGIIFDKKVGPLTDEELANKVGKLFVVQEDVGEINYLDDGTPYLIHPNELLSGGPPKDGIPSIDNPEFVSVKEADAYIEDDEWVIGVSIEGEHRAYPFNILVWHELVNDVIGNEAILVSYCPLCGTAIVFDRMLDTQPVEFGVSGLLYNSDMVMYDRSTDSYWEQLTGRGIIGEHTGRVLPRIPSNTLLWSEWKELYPDSVVLSQKTGHIRRYGQDPYGDYYTNERTIFPVDGTDDRLHPKDIIYGLEINGEARAYPKSTLKRIGTVVDELGGTALTITHSDKGEVVFTDSDRNIVAPIRSFWFAWFAFHPHTDVFTE